MLPKQLLSLQHPIIKHLIKLREDKEYRNTSSTLLLIGKKMVMDISTHTPILNLFVTKNHLNIPIVSNKIYLVSEMVMQKISKMPSPEGIAAEIAIPTNGQDCFSKNWILIFNGISDPGNLGTLFRTAVGLKWESAILTPNTVDPFHEKSLRASQGTTILLPFTYASEEEILSKNLSLFVADKGGSSIEECSFSPPLALVLGHESKGPSFTFLQSSATVAIPMSPNINSFNVAIAGSILMYRIKHHEK